MKKSIKIVAIILAFIFTFVAGGVVDHFVFPSGKSIAFKKEVGYADICQMTNLQYSEYCENVLYDLVDSGSYKTEDEYSNSRHALYDRIEKMENDLRKAVLVDESGDLSLYNNKYAILEQLSEDCSEIMWNKYQALRED